ncbi:hypothetical protein JXA32_09705 [Candidatus Sumerlaeota bacterium]|nr:hypothetical protein [Candidatus Sumerlaeota bacterium]
MTLDFWRRIGELLINTGAVTGWTLLISGVLGVTLGLLLFRLRLPGAGIYRGMLVAGLFIPMHVSVTAWRAVWLPFSHTLPEQLHAALLQAPAYVPLMAWFTGLALLTADPSNEDQALLDARPAKVWLRVTLREAAPTLLAGLILVAIFVSGEITATDVLAVRTFAEEIYTQFVLQKPAQALGVALVLSTLTLALCVAFLRFLRPLTEVSLEGFGRRLQRRATTAEKPLLAVWIWLILAALWGVPLFYLVRAVKAPRLLWQAAQVVREEIVCTLALGAVGALIIAMLAPLLARGMDRWRKRHPRRFHAGALGLFLLAMLPAPLVGWVILYALRQPFVPAVFSDTAIIVLLVWTARFLPLSALIALPFVAAQPEEIGWLRRLDGTNPVQRLLFIILPIDAPLIGALTAMNFAWIIGELGATAIAVPPGLPLLSVRIFTLLHYGVYYEVAGAALILLLPMLLAGAILAGAVNRMLARIG